MITLTINFNTKIKCENCIYIELAKNIKKKWAIDYANP